MQQNTKKVNGLHFGFRVMAFLLSAIILFNIFPPFKVSAAASLWASEITTDSITLSWQTDAVYDEYQIYRANTLNGDYALFDCTYDMTTYTDTLLDADTFYYYKIVCMTGEVATETLGPVSLRTEPLSVTLGAPTNLSAEGTSTESILLNWTGVQNASAYNVYRSLSPTGPLDFVNQVEAYALSYSDEGLTPNTTYYYKVVAVSSTGEEGIYSDVAFAKTNNLPAVSVPAPVISIPSYTKTFVLVTWDSVGSGITYEVWRSDHENGTYTNLGTSVTDRYLDRAVSENTTYYYKAVAVDSQGNRSPESNIASVKTPNSVPKTTATATALDHESILVEWLNANADSYIIYMATSRDGTYTEIGSATRTHYTCSGLSPNTSYYFKVSAVINEVVGEQSLSTTAKTAPLKPTPTAVANSAESITISWDSVGNDVSYQVLRSETEEGPYVFHSYCNQTYYEDFGLTANTTYYYRIIAVGNTGSESLESDTTSATTLGVAPTPTATALSHQSVLVEWDDVGADSYTIYMATELDGTYIEIGQVPNVGSLSYTYTACEANTTYFFKVSATTNDVEGAQSDAASAKTFPAKPTPAANADSEQAITVTWASVGDDVSYEVWSSDFESGTYVRVGTSNSLRYTHTGLTANKTYYYKVVAVGSTGHKSRESIIVSATTLGPVPVPTPSATALNSFSIKVSWADESVSGYNVYRSDTEDGTYTIIASNHPSLNYTDRTAAPGTTYYYKVSAVTSGGRTGEKSAPTSATTYAAIPTPTATSFTLSDVSIQVDWDDVGADSYKVYVSSTLNGPYVHLHTTSNLTQTVTGLFADTTYYFKVEGVMNDGPTSALSNATSSRTLAVAPIPVPTPVATALNTTSIKIEWDDLAVNGYYIYRSNSLNGTYTPIVFVNTGTYLTDAGLLSNTTYYYKVACVDENNVVGAQSNVVSAKTFGPLNTPVVTASVRVSNIQLTWYSIPDAVTYHVYRASSIDGQYDFLGPVSSTSYLNTGLEQNTTYYYQVRAVGTNGRVSELSVPVSATTPAIPAAPVITATALSTNSIQVTWDNVPLAVMYRVYRADSEDGTYTLVSTAFTNSFNHTGLQSNTTYYYKVRSISAIGLESALSEPAFATTLTPLATPTLTATITDRMDVDLTWDAVPGATSYVVMRSNELHPTFTTISEVTGTTYTDSVTPYITYNYKIYAKNSSLNSADSNIESVVVLPCVVTLHPNNGVLTGSDTIHAIQGLNLSTPADPTREHHTFLGWYKDIDGNEVWDFANHVVTGDMTLYAKWSQTPVTETPSPTEPPKTDETPKPSEPTKPGNSSSSEESNTSAPAEEPNNEAVSSSSSSETNEPNSTSQEKQEDGAVLNIGNTNIPLSAQGNAWSLVNLVLLVFSFINALISFLRKKKDTPKNPRYTAKTQKLMYIGGGVLFLLNVLLIVLTQNFSALMVLFDSFTPIVAILMLSQIALFHFAKSRATVPNDETAA